MVTDASDMPEEPALQGERIPSDEVSSEPSADGSAQRRRALIGIIILVLILILFQWFWAHSTGVIPNVIGMPEMKARLVIAEAGFRVGEEHEVTADHVRPGEVAAQVPSPGKRTFLGAAVDIDCAIEPEKAATGEVVAATPFEMPGDDGNEDSGRLVAPGSATFGPIVPNVHGWSRSRAVDALVDAGYRVKVNYATCTTDVKAGRVFFQDPPPGAEAKRGTVVKLSLSIPMRTGAGYRPPRPSYQYR